MAEIEVNGTRLSVDDSFLELPSDQQQEVLRQFFSSQEQPVAPTEPETTSNPLTGAVTNALSLGQNLGQGVQRLEALEGRVLPESIRNLIPGRRAARAAADALSGLDETIEARPRFESEVSIEDVRANPTPGNIARFGASNAVASAPSFIAAATPVGAAALAISEANRGANERAANQGRETPNVSDSIVGGSAGLLNAALERAGARFALGRSPSGLLGVPAAAGVEAGTEAVQGGSENLLTTVGTERGFNRRDFENEILGSAITGGVTGGTARGAAQARRASRTVGDRVTLGEVANDPDALAARQAVFERLKAAKPVANEGKRGLDLESSVLRNIGDEIESDIRGTVKTLRQRGSLTEADVSTLTDSKVGLIKRANNTRRVLTEKDKGASDLERLEKLDAAPEVKIALRRGLLELSEARSGGIAKNAVGPLERAGSAIGGAIGVGTIAVPPAATARVGRIIGRGLDTISANRRPAPIQRAKARARQLDRLGVDTSQDSAALLADIRARAASGVQLGTPSAKRDILAEARSRAELRRANFVPTGGIDNLAFLSTGLLPKDFARAVGAGIREGRVSPAEAKKFFRTPELFQQEGDGKGGLRFLDKIGATAQQQGIRSPADLLEQARARLSLQSAINGPAVSGSLAEQRFFRTLNQATDTAVEEAPNARARAIALEVANARTQEAKTSILEKALSERRNREIRGYLVDFVRPLTQFGPSESDPGF